MSHDLDGAYMFARNILAAIVMDMIDAGMDEARIERLLQRIDEASATLPETARERATNELSVVIAALRASRPRGTDRTG